MKDRLIFALAFIFILFVTIGCYFEDQRGFEKYKLCIENGGNWESTWGGTCTLLNEKAQP